MKIAVRPRVEKESCVEPPTQQPSFRCFCFQPAVRSVFMHLIITLVGAAARDGGGGGVLGVSGPTGINRASHPTCR
jgi:hypothetical protein